MPPAALAESHGPTACTAANGETPLCPACRPQSLVAWCGHVAWRSTAGHRAHGVLGTGQSAPQARQHCRGTRMCRCRREKPAVELRLMRNSSTCGFAGGEGGNRAQLIKGQRPVKSGCGVWGWPAGRGPGARCQGGVLGMPGPPPGCSPCPRLLPARAGATRCPGTAGAWRRSGTLFMALLPRVKLQKV